MAHIHIKRAHQLPLAEIKQKAELLASNLQGRVGGSYRWKGDSVHYRYSGVTARIDCATEEILIDVKLGFMASIFRSTIEDEMKETLDKHLG